jgi:hypothetical protein
MKSFAVAALAAMLAACSPSEPRQDEVVVDAESVTIKPAKVPEVERARDCDSYVAELFDMLVKRKADGWTERDGLAELTARGDHSLGYVADGVFGTRYGEGGSAMARNDVLAACRRMAEGGELY